jgi:hypothetical protein
MALIAERHAAAESLRPNERRSAMRFPIERDARYRVYKRSTIEVGTGKTINMSSTGVLFTTQRALKPGERIELSAAWPAQLDNKCPLKLVMSGRVIRASDAVAAMVIERYEFRTQGIHRML